MSYLLPWIYSGKAIMNEFFLVGRKTAEDGSVTRQAIMVNERLREGDVESNEEKNVFLIFYLIFN